MAYELKISPVEVDSWSEFNYNRFYILLMLKREGEEYQEQIRKLKGL